MELTGLLTTCVAILVLLCGWVASEDTFAFDCYSDTGFGHLERAVVLNCSGKALASTAGLGAWLLQHATFAELLAKPKIELTLSFDSNAIRTVGVFPHLPRARRLSLSRNLIQEILPGAFTNLTNLQELDLSHNLITVTEQQNSKKPPLRTTITKIFENNKCDILDHPLRPPFVKCANGHNVCGSCRQQLTSDECPYCRVPLTTVIEDRILDEIFYAVHPTFGSDDPEPPLGRGANRSLNTTSAGPSRLPRGRGYLLSQLGVLDSSARLPGQRRHLDARPVEPGSNVQRNLQSPNPNLQRTVGRDLIEAAFEESLWGTLDIDDAGNIFARVPVRRC